MGDGWCRAGIFAEADYFWASSLLCDVTISTRTHSMARHRKSPRSRRYLMVLNPLTSSQGHQFDPKVIFFIVSWSTAHPF